MDGYSEGMSADIRYRIPVGTREQLGNVAAVRKLVWGKGLGWMVYYRRRGDMDWATGKVFLQGSEEEVVKNAVAYLCMVL